MNAASELRIFPTIRIRPSPFWEGVIAAGVKTCSVYNHMILPVSFDAPELDYRHLKTHVQVWDVGCQRQVAVRGPDAADLVAMLTPRDLSNMKIGQCYYIPVVDRDGGMLNDPLLLMLGQNSYWISLADSDLLLWVLGLAQARKMDVEVFEPDISPLAVQGPKSGQLMERVFGSKVSDLKFFGFGVFRFGDCEHIVGRSGWSKQGGFEVYVDGFNNGMPIWNALIEAGRDLNVRVGSPNYAERIEGGLLSYGSDMTRENNPFECGFDKYCNLDSATDCIGHVALSKIRERGPERQIRALTIDGPPVPCCHIAWPVNCEREFAGRITSATWSWDFGTNVAIGMIEKHFLNKNMELEVLAPDGSRQARVRKKFFN